jgi:hypothetical protein
MKNSAAYMMLLLLLPLPHRGLAQNVVINEIGWMGTRASASDEWIELCNTTPFAIDLKGWSLIAADGAPSILLAGIIPPQGFYVLERTDDQTISDRPAEQFFTGDLKNTGEFLRLRDADSLLIDQVRCDSSGWPAGTNTPKRSMEKKHPMIDALLPSSWASNDSLTHNGTDANGNPIYGTPGALNSVYDHSLSVELGSRDTPSRDYPKLVLIAGYPNPFSPGVTLEWQPPESGSAIEIIDLLGRVVRAWPAHTAAVPGKQRLYWDGCDTYGRPVANGTYLCRLRLSSGMTSQLRLTRCR